MSELKYYKLFHRTSALTSPEFISVVEFGTGEEVYLKSEADKEIAEKDKEIAEQDKEIAEFKEQVHDYALGFYVMQARSEKQLRHSNYKRCLAMARWCRSRSCFYDTMRENSLCWGWKSDRAYKWHKRWLELAEKFKEAK